MGKKKGKNTNVSETAPTEGISGSRPSPQGTPSAGPSSQSGSGQGLQRSEEMLSQKLSSLSVKSDGSQGGSGGSQPPKQSKGGSGGTPAKKQPQGSGGASSQKPSQGGPPSQGAPLSQPQKSAWGQQSGKSSSQSGQQVGPAEKPQKGQQGASSGQPQKRSQDAPSGQYQKGPQGAPPGQYQKGPQGAPPGHHPKGPQGTPSGQPQKGSQGAPSRQYQKGPQDASSGYHPKGPQGAPSEQYQKGQQGAPSGQPQKSSQGAPSGQSQKGPRSALSEQHQKGPQGASKAQNKGPEQSLSPGSSFQKPPQSGAAGLKQMAAIEPSTSQVAKETKSLMVIPPRKADGTLGRKIKLGVNLLELKFDKLCPKIIHYDVAFDPERPKRLFRAALNEFSRIHFLGISVAFDGKKNLYAPRLLPFGTHIEDSVTVVNPERENNNQIEFKITIKYAQTIDTSDIKRFLDRQIMQPIEYPQAAIQAIDVVLRTALANTPLVPVARSYYIPPRNPPDLGGGLELWHGFYQSAILCWKPFLNIDVAHKGFPKPAPLIELLQEVCRLRGLGGRLYDDQIRKFRGFISTLKIRYELPNGGPNTRRVYRVTGLGISAKDHFFPANGNRINIVNYFRQEKGYTIRYPDLPTVQIGSGERVIYLPMELCTLIEGQAVNRKLDQFQTREMIREAAKPPLDRKERIMNAIQNAQHNASPVVNEFGIGVGNEFVEVPARVLDPPKIVYGNNSAIEPAGGQWPAGKFFSSNALENWVVLNLDSYTQPRTLERFSTELINQGMRQGMKIAKVREFKNLDSQPPRHRGPDPFLPALKDHLNDWKQKGVQLVLVVLPPSTDVYAKVKRTAELQIGILTQCVKCQTLKNERGFSSTCENLVKKMNAKTNGTNHKLGGEGRPWPAVLASVFEKPVMFVGIDVTHPSPDQRDIPSVAGVSASHDRTALFQYNMIWRVQLPRQDSKSRIIEIVQDLQNIIREHLMVFYRKTRCKPHKIIVYRDGVSEGQFRQVLTEELTAIRAACTSLEQAYEPGITFLVVQKRHHLRFFPKNPKEADRKGNVLPGTIVDTQITHPRELDFYLASHASLQGTSRPTKYHRLWDDNDISEDDLQVLTYYLCHLFSRCTRTVSYPAPTYYAHLAAYRGRVYLENNSLDLNDPAALQRFQNENQIQQDFLNNSPMFFV